MAFRTQALIGALLSWSAMTAAELRYPVRHDHWLKGGEGTLEIHEDGVRFHESKNRKHRWNWRWADIQQLKLSPRTVWVLTYEDVRLKLGQDRLHRFDLTGSGDFQDVWRLLRGRAEVRLVAALADTEAEVLWRVPVKLIRRFGGVQGILLATTHGLTFQADLAAHSRTWLWSDLDNVARTGPTMLTVTTYERALADYGSLKSFTFQLREPLAEDRFHHLWLQVQRHHGLKLLSDDTERSNVP